MPLSAAEIAELIDQHAAALRAWLSRRCAWPEDAVQEAFCRLATLDPRPDRPAAWLYQVARNFADKQRVSESRRRAREQATSRAEQVHGNPADPLEAADALAALNKLEEELREVVIARIWGQLSLEEVGRLCGVSTATAHRRLERALSRLREELTPHIPR